MDYPARFRSSHSTAVLLAVVLTAWLNAGSAVAQTFISPGESVVLSFADDLTCEEIAEGPMSDDGIEVTASCQVGVLGEVSERHLDVAVYSGFSLADLLEPQKASATARLINEILITTADPGAEVLEVQIATEVSWSGVLVVGGVNSTFAQVVATLQVRDSTTGLVVASDTFNFERQDAELTLDVLDAIDGVEITHSTGTEISALLVRGRTYSIEVEAKCDMAVPLLGGAVCSFFDGIVDVTGTAALFEGDGFDVGDITVTVASDPIAALLSD